MVRGNLGFSRGKWSYYDCLRYMRERDSWVRGLSCACGWKSQFEQRFNMKFMCQKYIAVMSQPPYSSDLARAGLCIISILQARLRASYLQPTQDIKGNSTTTLGSIRTGICYFGLLFIWIMPHPHSTTQHTCTTELERLICTADTKRDSLADNVQHRYVLQIHNTL